MTRIYKNLVVDALTELSDRQLQERRWMSTGEGEVSSFVEAVEGLFTDSGLDDASHAVAAGFSPEAASKLQELETQLAKINSDNSPRSMIDGPAMSRVRALATEILRLIEDP